MLIKFLRYQSNYNRVICHASLYEKDDPDDSPLFQGPLAAVLTYCRDNDYEVENSQAVLNALVLEQGFAA
jgi:hypothetical protein